jgi:hypothetical protein
MFGANLSLEAIAFPCDGRDIYPVEEAVDSGISEDRIGELRPSLVDITVLRSG